MSGGAALGVAFSGHLHPLPALERLVRRADSLGYAQILVDGDAVVIEAKPEQAVYDSTALAAAVALWTARARIGSIHFAPLWNPVGLARSLATLQSLSHGRLVALFGIGGERALARLGWPEEAASERIARLDELLDALRALLSGETVSRAGRSASFERVRVTPPPKRIPIAISAAGPRALALVDRHADVWDANVPPLRERLEPLRARLSRELPTWLWIFARPGAALDDAARAYRKHAPWFRELAPVEVERAILWGDPARARARLEALRAELGLALPILDLAGLDAPNAARALEAFAPAPIEGIS